MEIQHGSEVQSFVNDICITPTFVDHQGDICICGKCKKQFNTLIEFISHKREHMTETNLHTNETDQRHYNNLKLVTLAQQSNEIWVWNEDDPVATDYNNLMVPADNSVVNNTVSQCNVKSPKIVEIMKTTNVDDRTIQYYENTTNKTQSINIDTPITLVDNSSQVVQTPIDKKKFQCVICARTFSHKSNLKKHILSHKVWPDGLSKSLPNYEAGYFCSYCQKRFKTFLKLKTHLNEHRHEKLFKCIQTKCNDMFNDLESLISHINVNHPIMEYHCHLCSLTLTSLSEMAEHQKNHSNKSNAVKKSFTCLYCRAIFKKRNHLEHHLATVSHVNKCSQCSKVFVSEKSLRRHMLCHTSIKIYQCNFCGLSFRSKHYLSSHVLTHSKEKNFVCSICDVKFRRKDILVRHIKIHQPNQKKHCPFRSHLGCMMEFTRTDKLNHHVKSHTLQDSKRKVKKGITTPAKEEQSTIEIIIVPMTETKKGESSQVVTTNLTN